jgi:hypothetical protein
MAALRHAHADAALAMVFGRPCSCPEHHAVTGACHQKAETATDAGGMCLPCAYAYQGTDWLGNQPLLAASTPANRPLR